MPDLEVELYDIVEEAARNELKRRPNQSATLAAHFIAREVLRRFREEDYEVRYRPPPPRADCDDYA